MKVFCCFTPAHEILLRDYFLPSLPGTFSASAIKFDIEGAGDFFSPEFLRCIARKIDLILASLRENPDDIIVWSDVDIQFFEIDPDNLSLELGNYDIAFQREGKMVPDVNAGFFVCRCGVAVVQFFERVREGLERNPSMNEQHVINHLLSEHPADLSWTYLPFTYYARTHGWPPPRHLALYHANATSGRDGVRRKERQFRELGFLRRWGIFGLMVTSIKYATRRIYRRIRERLSRVKR